MIDRPPRTAPGVWIPVAFDGLELVEPGVVQLSKWRPDTELEAAAAAALWGGLARKP